MIAGDCSMKIKQLVFSQNVLETVYFTFKLMYQGNEENKLENLKVKKDYLCKSFLCVCMSVSFFNIGG